MDEQVLMQLGLNASEIRLYKTVVTARHIAPSELAKAIDVKRTTAYSMARGLVEKGLLLEDGTRRPRVFAPAGPEEIQVAIDAEKKRSQERQALLERLSEKVSQTQAETSYPVPRIKFIEEGKLEQYLYKTILIWWGNMQQTNERTWWGFQDASFAKHFAKWIDWQWEQAPETIDLKLLTNFSKTERELTGKYSRRNVKFWGEATNFVSSTWVMGDYVVMINTRQNSFYLVEIHSKTLAHDQREVFRNLWELV